MILEIITIILGFILLVVGADLLVKGCINVAKKFHIPEILIGLTIIALGTSAPEIIITVTSANKGSGDLIIGNAIGSNLCNLLLILGLMAVLRPVKVDKDVKKLHIPISFFATMFLLIMAIVNKINGFILLVLFIIYFIYPIIIEIKDILKAYKEKDTNNNIKIWTNILFVILGVILLKYGSDFVVDNCIEIARNINISERVIGLTIIAIGTALPELVTSMVATIKKDTDLAVGNLVGSCVLNLLLILGIGGIINPLELSKEFINNLIILLGVNFLIWLFCFLGKKNTITRTKGSILIVSFFIYLCSLFI